MFETDACRHAHAQVCAPVEIKATITPAEEPGVFEGYGAVFGNRDRDGDVIAPGAFAASLKKGLPILLWQHNQKEPIGTFEVVREDKRGLFVRGRLAQVGRGAEAYALLKMGALNGLSIGFMAREASRNQTTGVRTIHRADLMEVSLVTFPANDLARVASVKNADMDSEFDGAPVGDARSFERMLRENGFSRSRAKAITAKGFRAGDLEAAEASEIRMMIKELSNRMARMEEKRYKLLVPVYEGRPVTKTLFYSINRPWITLSVVPRDPDVSFKVSVRYHYWDDQGPIARHAHFDVLKGRGTFSKALKVRRDKASVAERLLGGRHGSITKKLEIELTAIRGSTSFEVRVN